MKEKIRKLLLCTLLVIPLIATGNVDSLERELETAAGTDRLVLIGKLAKALNRKDRTKGNEYLLMYESEYRALNNPPEFEGDYFSSKGTFCHNTGKTEDAVKYFLLAQEIFERKNDYQKMWEVYHNLGAVYEDMGDYGKSLEVYLKALHIAEEHLEEGAVAGSSNNLGIIYADQGKFEEAIQYFHLSREVYSRNPLSWGYGNSLNNLGQCYNLINKTDSSEFYFKKALEVWEGAADQKGIAMTNHNLGALYGRMQKLDLAEKHLLKSLELSEAMNEHFGIALNLGTLSELYFDQKKEEKGFIFLKKAIEESRSGGLLPLLQNNLKKISARYKEKQMFKDALYAHEEFFEIYDSMNNVEKTKNLQELTEKFESEKKEAEIARQNEELAIKDLKISKDQNRMLMLGGSLLLVIGFAFFTMINLRQKKKANQEITQQKNEIEKQKDELEEKNREITDSIMYAKNLQDAILPPRKLVKQYLENSFILYKPKDIIAGDFYFMEVKNNHIIFAAADCTGHGVPGAMVSVVCANAMNRAVKEFGLLDPGKILDQVSMLVKETFEKM